MNKNEMIAKAIAEMSNEQKAADLSTDHSQEFCSPRQLARSQSDYHVYK